MASFLEIVLVFESINDNIRQSLLQPPQSQATRLLSYPKTKKKRRTG